MASEIPDLRQQIRHLTADRRSAEARALYGTLARYVERRVRHVVRHAASDLVSASEAEEVVGDVLLQLMTGSLATFRGSTLNELTAFVRTVTDRRLWRVIKRKVKEKRMLETVEPHQAHAGGSIRRPDELVRMVPDLPLSDKDEAYLRELLAAGSKAELARRRSLSRAAVTQRVKRIRNRIEKLQPKQRLAVDAWLRQTAREVLEEQAGDQA